MTRARTLLPVALLACVPPAGAPTSGETTSSDPSTTAEPGGTTDMSPETGEAPACIGPPDDVEVALKFDGRDVLGYPVPVQIYQACVVRGLGNTDVDTGIILFDCDLDPDSSDNHSVEIKLDRPLRAAPMAIDQEVRLRLQIRGGGDSSLFLAIHDTEGELALAFASASSLPGDDLFPPPEFFAPLTLTPVWPCPFECPGFGGIFIIPDCICVHRGAIEFGYREQAIRVDDHGVGELSGTQRFDLRVLELGAIDRETCESLAEDDTGITLRLFAARML